MTDAQSQGEVLREDGMTFAESLSRASSVRTQSKRVRSFEGRSSKSAAIGCCSTSDTRAKHSFPSTSSRWAASRRLRWATPWKCTSRVVKTIPASCTFPKRRPTSCASGTTSQPPLSAMSSSRVPSWLGSRVACRSTSASRRFCRAARSTFAPSGTSTSSSVRSSSSSHQVQQEAWQHRLVRRVLLEQEREELKKDTLQKLAEGEVMPGTVKNITEYGAFVDLGGIDGLLHITDMSWGRINHPSEMFNLGQEIDVKILKFDPDSERVSLGYKQITEDRGRMRPRSTRSASASRARSSASPITARSSRSSRGRGTGARLGDELDEAGQAPPPSSSRLVTRSRQSCSIST